MNPPPFDPDWHAGSTNYRQDHLAAPDPICPSLQHATGLPVAAGEAEYDERELLESQQSRDKELALG